MTVAGRGWTVAVLGQTVTAVGADAQVYLALHVVGFEGDQRGPSGEKGQVEEQGDQAIDLMMMAVAVLSCQVSDWCLQHKHPWEDVNRTTPQVLPCINTDQLRLIWEERVNCPCGISTG